MEENLIRPDDLNDPESPTGGFGVVANRLANMDAPSFERTDPDDSDGDEVTLLDGGNLQRGVDGSPERMAKSLTLLGGVSLIMGTMIGSGIFASPGSVLLHAGSVGTSLLAWFFAGLIALLGSLCYAELGTMIPSSGGEYTYITMAYGDLMGFVYIWSTVMVTKPGSLAIITLVSGQYIAKIIYSDSDEEPPEWVAKTISIFELAVLTLINSISVTCANKTMIVFTSLKALALAMIGVLGLVWIARNVNTEGTPAYKNFHDAFESDGDGSGGDGSASGAAEFGVAVLAGLWSFDGWNNLNIVTEELIDPARNLPRALAIGVPIVTAAYIMANIGYFAAMNLDQIVDRDKGAPVEGFATSFGEVTMGDVGLILLPLCIAASTFGAANGSAFTGGRLFYVSAKNGDFPQFFAKLYGNKTPAPMRGLVAQAVLATMFVLPGNFESLLACFSVAAWIFYLMAVTCLFWFRWKEPDRHRPFRVWLVVPIVFCATSLVLVIAIIAQQPYESLVALVLIATAFPVYYGRIALRRRGYIGRRPG